jgi:dihydrofolate synthase / folylpolyglutamate synthase
VTFEDACAYLAGLADNERALPRTYDKATYGLERAAALAALLGDPQFAYRVIQVGGTNGKGSVSAFAESILRHAGLRTGLTTSPHLLDLRERIRIAGRLVGRGLFAESVGALAEARERLPEEWQATVTFFEAITISAFEAFRRAEVDVAVVEVGLGGRFDATSIARPDVLVLTPIGLDHQAFLGDTVEQIAWDKSHLIRSAAPVVIGSDEPAREVFRARATEHDAPVHVLGEDFAPEALPLGLAGEFQTRNAACARRAVELLLPRVPLRAVTEGLLHARWPGRFQVVDGAPPIVLDGAMNEQSSAALGRELAARFAGQPVALVLGLSADKSPEGFLGALGTAGLRIESVIACAARTPRAMPADELASRIARLGPERVEVVHSVEDALERSRRGSGGVVCVTGSLYVVAEAMRYLGLRAFAEAEDEGVSS